MKIDNFADLYVSLSSHPGSFGFKFFNYFFEKYMLNAIYKPLQLQDCYFDEFCNVVHSFKKIGVKGVSVSMPFKRFAARACEDADFENINTIRFSDGYVRGFNTDIVGFEKCLQRTVNCKDNMCANFLIYGNGAVSKSIQQAMKSRDFLYSVYKRGQEKVFDDEHHHTFLVNASPVGMSCIKDEIFTEKRIRKFNYVFDVVNQKDTKLIKIAKKLKKICIPGSKMSVYGAQKQFEIYTGIKLSDKEVENFYEQI